MTGNFADLCGTVLRFWLLHVCWCRHRVYENW